MDAPQVYKQEFHLSRAFYCSFSCTRLGVSDSKLSGMQHKCRRADEKSGNRCEKGVRKKEKKVRRHLVDSSRIRADCFFGEGGLKDTEMEHLGRG